MAMGTISDPAAGDDKSAMACLSLGATISAP
jgi:hypothetical protein